MRRSAPTSGCCECEPGCRVLVAATWSHVVAVARTAVLAGTSWSRPASKEPGHCRTWLGPFPLRPGPTPHSVIPLLHTMQLWSAVHAIGRACGVRRPGGPGAHKPTLTTGSGLWFGQQGLHGCTSHHDGICTVGTACSASAKPFYSRTGRADTKTRPCQAVKEAPWA